MNNKKEYAVREGGIASASDSIKYYGPFTYRQAEKFIINSVKICMNNEDGESTAKDYEECYEIIPADSYEVHSNGLVSHFHF